VSGSGSKLRDPANGREVPWVDLKWQPKYTEMLEINEFQAFFVLG
jgi:hypothetical protein